MGKWDYSYGYHARSENYKIAKKYDFDGMIYDLVHGYSQECTKDCDDLKRKIYIAKENDMIYILPESEKNIFKNLFESLPGEKTTDALERFFKKK